MNVISKRRLVEGRAGELVTSTDKKTFDLLNSIFAHKGPYRTVLAKFGIETNDSRSFLVYKDGKVYSDIDIENEVLWNSCLSKLVLKNGKAQLSFSLNIAGLKGFIRKTSIEASIINKPQNSFDKCKDLYCSYSELLENTIRKGTISVNEFLSSYESIVYITYLYELFYNYNSKDKVTTNCLKTYVNENDYLLRYDDSFMEIKYRSKTGFSLVNREKIKENILETPFNSLQFIPAELAFPMCSCKEIKNLEIYLQCLKNNLRLKSEILMQYIID